MFAFWLNTKFIEGNYLCLEKSVLDKACKDKKHKAFPPGFRVELFLRRIDELEDDVKPVPADAEIKKVCAREIMLLHNNRTQFHRRTGQRLVSNHSP